MRPVVAAAVLMLGVIGACGNADDELPRNAGSSVTATAPAEPDSNIPECEDVWSTSETLPNEYRQCVDQSGSTTGVVGRCADGVHYLASWDGWWGITGEPIKDIPAEFVTTPNAYPELAAAIDECAGD